MTHVAFAAHMLTLLEFMKPDSKCQYIVSSDEGTSYCSLAEQGANQ
jgi:hypothetical protein